jgi:hypothetical protein
MVTLSVIAMLVSSSCAADVATGPGSASRDVGISAPLPTISAPEASILLGGLPRQARSVGFAGYSRDAFGQAWKDIDGNGCNQRDDVLLRDAVGGSARVQRQGGCDHDVVAGSWIDPYTGAQLTFTNLKDQHQAQAVQIDHVVPLAEAWVSGASTWSARKRLRYANDIRGLVASSGPVNASKGSFDPAAWRPKYAHQCAYATRWIATKGRWRLAVDASEVRALEEMLDACDA